MAPRNPILNPDQQTVMDNFWEGAMVQQDQEDALTLHGFAMDAKENNIDDFSWASEGGAYTAELGVQSGTGGGSYGGGVSELHSCESDIITH